MVRPQIKIVYGILQVPHFEGRYFHKCHALYIYVCIFAVSIYISLFLRYFSDACFAFYFYNVCISIHTIYIYIKLLWLCMCGI